MNARIVRQHQVGGGLGRSHMKVNFFFHVMILLIFCGMGIQGEFRMATVQA
jgi:hypothetical protein